MRTHPRRGGRVGSLWRAELARGLTAQMAGDDDAARTAMTRAATLAPDAAEPPFALGRLAERNGRGDEAERHYRRALQLRPSWPLAAAALARRLGLQSRPAFGEAAQPARAVDAARSAQAVDATQSARAADATRSAKAAEAAQSARAAEADRLLQATLASAPDHPLLLMVTGELALERERAADAIAAFSAARQAGADAAVVDHALARAHNLAAIALADDGRSDEALFGFRRACVLAPTWAPPRVNLGALWQRLNKPLEALRQYRQAVALDPRNGTAQLNLGLLLRDRHDLAGATRALTAAYATADPPHPRARMELALTLSAQGEHARAIALFAAEAQHGDGNRATAYANLGVAWLLANDLTKAQQALQTALALDPTQAAALRNLAHVLARRGRLVDAAVLVRRANGNSHARAESK